MSISSGIRNLVMATLVILALPVFAELEVGDMAPDFRLMGSDGNEYTLSQFKGNKPVVIAFFPKAYTGGCTIECKALRDADAEIQSFDVAYFMASVDNPEDNKGFAEQNSATFPILSDPDKAMCEDYGVLSERGYARRWTFYIDAEGIVRKIDKAVNPKQAGEELVASLESLGFSRSE